MGLFTRVQDFFDRANNTLRVRHGGVVDTQFLACRAFRRVIIEGNGRLLIRENHTLVIVSELDMRKVTTGGVFLGNRRIPL